MDPIAWLAKLIFSGRVTGLVVAVGVGVGVVDVAGGLVAVGLVVVDGVVVAVGVGLVVGAGEEQPARINPLTNNKASATKKKRFI